MAFVSPPICGTSMVVHGSPDDDQPKQPGCQTDVVSEN
jgi:hypothetical protein